MASERTPVMCGACWLDYDSPACTGRCGRYDDTTEVEDPMQTGEDWEEGDTRNQLELF